VRTLETLFLISLSRHVSLAITLRTIEVALKGTSSSASSSLGAVQKPRYQDLPLPNLLVYSDQILSAAKRVLHLQRHQPSSESTEEFQVMIREFCKKDGIHRLTAEHLINIFSMLSPSLSPLAVTSRGLLSLYSTQSLSSYITSTLSEHHEYSLSSQSKHKKIRGSIASVSSSSPCNQSYLSVTTTDLTATATEPPVASTPMISFSSLDVMTCALVPTFLSSHEQTIGSLVSLSSLLPTYPPDELSILILPSDFCFSTSPLRLDLLLCLPAVTDHFADSPVPNLVSRTLLCLHGLVSRSLLCDLSDPQNNSLSNTNDSFVKIDEDCLSTVRTHRHSLLLPVIQTCLEHSLRLLFFSLQNQQHQGHCQPSSLMTSLSPLTELSLRYVSVCLILLEQCFTPTDCCVTILESFLFEKPVLLAFISFSLPYQPPQAFLGKFLALSVLLRCCSILFTHFSQQDLLLNPMTLYPLISLLELYQSDENLVDYSLVSRDQHQQLLQQGRTLLMNFLPSLSSLSSPGRPMAIEMERIVFEERTDSVLITQQKPQQRSESSYRAAVVLCTSVSPKSSATRASTSLVEVTFSFPQRLHWKKKLNLCLEKLSIAIAILPSSPPASLCLSSSSSSCSSVKIHLSPRILLKGYLSHSLLLSPLSLETILFFTNLFSAALSIYSSALSSSPQSKERYLLPFLRSLPCLMSHPVVS
jgi:hypothetical protein